MPTKDIGTRKFIGKEEVRNHNSPLQDPFFESEGFTWRRKQRALLTPVTAKKDNSKPDYRHHQLQTVKKNRRIEEEKSLQKYSDPNSSVSDIYRESGGSRSCCWWGRWVLGMRARRFHLRRRLAAPLGRFSCVTSMYESSENSTARLLVAQ